MKKFPVAESHLRVCNPKEDDQLVKTLEGWSVINLSDSYAMSAADDGEKIDFKLRIYDSKVKKPQFRVSQTYDMLSPKEINVFYSQLLT